jgi:hypothetical protein
MQKTFDLDQWRERQLAWLAQLIEENWCAIRDGREEFPVPPTRIECVKLCLRQAKAQTGEAFDEWVASALTMNGAQARALLGVAAASSDREVA